MAIVEGTKVGHEFAPRSAMPGFDCPLSEPSHQMQ